MSIRREFAYIRRRLKVRRIMRANRRIAKKDLKMRCDKDPDGGFVDEWRKLP